MDLSTLFLPLMLVAFVAMILISGRKQRQQMQETQKMQSELADGDVVMTTSGLRGTVVDASYEDTIDLEIAPGVVTTWSRAAVREKVKADADAAGTDAPDDEPAGSPSERPGA
jgi:preprotein translocase subunit YajC